jgi:hypothetical protein
MQSNVKTDFNANVTIPEIQETSIIHPFGVIIGNCPWPTWEIVTFSKIASQVGHYDNPWLILYKYIDAVNENCVKNMLPKWEIMSFEL